MKFEFDLSTKIDFDGTSYCTSFYRATCPWNKTSARGRLTLSKPLTLIVDSPRAYTRAHDGRYMLAVTKVFDEKKFNSGFITHHILR